MKPKNKLYQPFIMVLVVTTALLVMSQFDNRINVWDYQSKKINLLADIFYEKKVKIVPIPKPIIKDTIILKVKDSIKFTLSRIDSTDIYDFYMDSTSALAHFFEALKASQKQKGKTRIAYFGDSMIEGDLITQDLRNCLQDTFGGTGVGFVPITSIVAGFRKSVIHSYNGWTTYNLLKNAPSRHYLGISGYVFSPNTINAVDTVNSTDDCWVKYTAINKKHLDKFYEIKLLYGKSNGDNQVIINGSSYRLKGNNVVNQLVINNKKGCKSLNAKFKCTTPIDIFGFSFESDSGVFVDNFSFRGNSGLPISQVSQNVYSATNSYLGYDLIILEYGLNAVNPSITNFSWYERGMNNVIKHIKASFPNTSILLISVGDKGYRKDGVYQTDPSVPLLIEAQKRMAKNNQLAFWSLYDAMGGNGSMVKWVEGDTVLANKDYTHFNLRGAHKIGKLLFNKLMNEYSDYNKKHP